jgi:hypothetical protein
MKELFTGLTLKQEEDNRRLREENLAGARTAVEEFWIALEGPMLDSEVFRKNKRGRQKIETSIAKKKKQKNR